MQSLRPKRVGSEDPSGGARSANGVRAPAWISTEKTSLSRQLMTESYLLRCPQVGENGRTCARSSSFRQERENRGLVGG